MKTEPNVAADFKAKCEEFEYKNAELLSKLVRVTEYVTSEFYKMAKKADDWRGDEWSEQFNLELKEIIGELK